MAELTSARWDISTRCNLNCEHCCAAGLFSDKSHALNLELAIHLLDRLKHNGITSLNLLGREPFLYPHIRNILQYACDHGFQVDITTNGTVIKESDLQFLATVGLRRIFFSVDGSCPEVNDAIRGSGVFHKLSSVMRALIAEKRRRHSRIKIVINTVLTKLNASDVPAIIDLANSLGVDGFKLSHLNLVGNAVAVSDRLALTAVDEFAVAEAVMRIIPNYPSITFDILSSKPKFLEYLYKAYSVSFPVTVSGCKACIREIYVDPTGHIAPCLSTYEGFSDIAQVDGTIKDYRINLLDLQHIPISDYPFYEEFRHAFPLTKDTYQHYVPCNTCPYLTTLCYPCPLGVAGRVHVEELCAIAEEKLQCFDRREN